MCPCTMKGDLLNHYIIYVNHGRSCSEIIYKRCMPLPIFLVTHQYKKLSLIVFIKQNSYNVFLVKQKMLHYNKSYLKYSICSPFHPGSYFHSLLFEEKIFFILHFGGTSQKIFFNLHFGGTSQVKSIRSKLFKSYMCGFSSLQPPYQGGYFGVGFIQWEHCNV